MNLKPFWTEILRNQAEPGAGGAASDPAPAEPNPDPDPAPEPSAGPDLSFLPDDYRTEAGDVDMEKFRAAWDDLQAESAQRAEAAGLVPENGEYDFSMPEVDYGELDLPDGFELNIASDDEDLKPIFGEVGEFLQGLGAPAEASQKVMGLLAKYEAAKYSKAHTAAKEQAEKLGANAAQREARISRLHRSMTSRLPKEQAEALMNATATYDGVRALEALFAPRGPGATPPRINGGDLEKMSAFDRLKAINSQQAKG